MQSTYTQICIEILIDSYGHANKCAINTLLLCCTTLIYGQFMYKHHLLETLRTDNIFCGVFFSFCGSLKVFKFVCRTYQIHIHANTNQVYRILFLYINKNNIN